MSQIVKISFSLPLPTAIVQICVWPLLLWRKIRYGYSFRKIKLTRGQFTLVDAKDFNELNKHKWMFGTNGYARRSGSIGKEKKKMFFMHRLIMAAPDKILIDHINHNGLDNRKANLRFATSSQSNMNRRVSKKPGISKYKGVGFDKRRNKWTAKIKYNKKQKYLGSHTDEKDAARAYNEAAKKYHGRFAVLNEF